MSTAKTDQNRYVVEAVDLIIRLQNDPTNPVTHEMVRNWRARGAEQAAAWDRVVRLYGASHKVMAGGEAASAPEKRLSRRTLLMAGLGLAGGSGLAWAFGPDLLLQARADHLTAAAETRTIPLTTGSTLVLGPKSAVAVDLDQGRCHVELLSGMGYFEVAERSGAPLSVGCGAVRAIADGEAHFAVSEETGTIELAVGAGAIAAHLGPAATALEAGDGLTADTSGQIIDHRVGGDRQIAAWRHNRLAVSGMSIGMLTAKIGRWLPGKVVLAAPDLAGRTVSGVFDLSQPLGALEAAVHPAGGTVRQFSPYLTVISQI